MVRYFRKTVKPSKGNPLTLMVQLLIAFSLLPLSFCVSSCTSLTTSLENVFGIYQQQATKAPYWRYMADLQMTVASETFEGSGVTDLTVPQTISIHAPMKIDRVEVEMCDREDICQRGQTCSDSFHINGWLTGNSNMTYKYVPTAEETDDDCNFLQFRIFNKSVLLSWGFLLGRESIYTLPATVVCNGVSLPVSGVTTCNPKTGKVNTIAFSTPIKYFDVDAGCNLKKIDSEHFTFAPKVGECTGVFSDGKNMHQLNVISYEEALIR